MRLLAVIFMFTFACLAQKDNRRAALALQLPKPQAAEMIQVPITKDMAEVLARFEASIQDGSTDHSEQVQKLFLSPSDLSSWMRPAAGVVPALPNPGEVISISLGSEMATVLEGLWINAYAQTSAIGADGSQTFKLAYATREQMFVSSLKCRGGLFWKLAIKFAPDELRARIAVSGVEDEVTVKSILAIIQGN